LPVLALLPEFPPPHPANTESARQGIRILFIINDVLVVLMAKINIIWEYAI
jgi:hypothetical protein